MYRANTYLAMIFHSMGWRRLIRLRHLWMIFIHNTCESRQLVKFRSFKKQQLTKQWVSLCKCCGYVLINLSRCGTALRLPRIKYCAFQKSPTPFGFLTSKEYSGQKSQKSAEFWYPINSFIRLNDAWSFFIFFQNLHFLIFPTIYSLPYFPIPMFPGGHPWSSAVTLIFNEEAINNLR